MKTQPPDPISDMEFFRLHKLYLDRTDPNRRAPARTERHIDVRPTMAGYRVVTWRQYEEMQAGGLAKAPVGARK